MTDRFLVFIFSTAQHSSHSSHCLISPRYVFVFNERIDVKADFVTGFSVLSARSLYRVKSDLSLKRVRIDLQEVGLLTRAGYEAFPGGMKVRAQVGPTQPITLIQTLALPPTEIYFGRG